MARVPRNKGSYFPRKGGAFQVKYPLGWSEETKRYEEYREDVASEAEAIALIKAINDFTYHGGSPSAVPAWRSGKKAEETGICPSVSQFAAEFTEMRLKQKKVEDRTIESDRECFARIAPYIGEKPVNAVTARDIDAAFAHMRSGGEDNLGGRAYSGTTLQKTYAYLSMLFDKAVDYDLIAKNPMARVERPRRDTAEKSALSPEQAQALFSAILSEPLEAKPVGVLLCLCCGLRESEMLALKWADYSDGSLSVSKSLVREKQQFKSTKNGEARTVPCPPPLIAVLDEWRDRQKEWYADNGLSWSEDSPIVQSRVGNHTLQRSFGKWFANARKRYPIPNDFTVHGLRHTYVTLLNRDCGVDPRTTRSMSGHKSEQAFAIYTHTDEEWRRKAASQLGNIIAPEDSASRCQNCRLWTVSPSDATKGACWADEGSGLSITGATEHCAAGRFMMRPSA
jgi:integrase